MPQLRGGVPVHASDRSLLVAATAAVVLLLVVTLIAAFIRPAAPSRDATPGGASGQIAAGGAAEDAASTRPPAPANVLAVVDSRAVTWVDVLGAWHGQVIVRVHNDGQERVAVLPADARVTVAGPGAAAVYEGAFDAAVPPVLPAGENGYLVVGFPLAAGEDDLSVEAVPQSGPAAGLLELEVRDATVRAEPGRVAVVGTAANEGDEHVRDAVVTAVALDEDGTPLAGFIDRASLGRLEAGAERQFEAAEPVSPPIDPADVDTLLVSAWGRAAP